MGEPESQRSTTVKIRILDKDYQVSCQPGDREALLESARYLDEHMRRVRQRGDIHGTERIAVMAALNITHDLLAGGGADEDVRAAAARRMREIGDRIDRALTAAGRTGS